MDVMREHGLGVHIGINAINVTHPLYDVRKKIVDTAGALSFLVSYEVISWVNHHLHKLEAGLVRHTDS